MGKALRNRQQRVRRNLALVGRVVDEAWVVALARGVADIEEYDRVLADCRPELRSGVAALLRPHLKPSIRNRLRLRRLGRAVNPFASETPHA